MSLVRLKAGAIVLLLTLFIVSPAFAGEKTRMDYAKALPVTLSYRAEEGGSFVVVLKNASKTKLNLMVATDELRGKFSVHGAKGDSKPFYQRNYLKKKLTGVLVSGACELEPGKELKWTIRLDELVFLETGNKPVTDTDLAGKSVSLSLEHLAVFPDIGKPSVGVEANSDVVQIPKMAK